MCVLNTISCTGKAQPKCGLGFLLYQKTLSPISDQL